MTENSLGVENRSPARPLIWLYALAVVGHILPASGCSETAIPDRPPASMRTGASSSGIAQEPGILPPASVISVSTKLLAPAEITGPLDNERTNESKKTAGVDEPTMGIASTALDDPTRSDDPVQDEVSRWRRIVKSLDRDIEETQAHMVKCVEAIGATPEDIRDCDVKAAIADKLVADMDFWLKTRAPSNARKAGEDLAKWLEGRINDLPELRGGGLKNEQIRKSVALSCSYNFWRTLWLTKLDAWEDAKNQLSRAEFRVIR
jgi:hypothetical protein